MVKTRLQSGAGYKGPIDAAQAILKNEGVGGFYRGASLWVCVCLCLCGLLVDCDMVWFGEIGRRCVFVCVFSLFFFHLFDSGLVWFGLVWFGLVW
jgi:hypothetical protein